MTSFPPDKQHCVVVANVFPTCVVDLLHPALTTRVEHLLARRGVTAVVTPNTTCCGQPAFNSGFVAAARRVATPTLRALAKTDGPIVVPSGSCAAMIARRWPEVFADTEHAAAAVDVAHRVAELSQALAGCEEPESGTAPTAAPGQETIPSRVAWHASCHARRELGVNSEPTDLLAAAGCHIAEPADADQCCGFGGTFSVRFAGVSVAMADAKLDALADTEAGAVVGGDLSCLAHLQARAEARRLPLRFEHLAERLDQEERRG